MLSECVVPSLVAELQIVVWIIHLWHGASATLFEVESKWWRDYDDKVAIHIKHAPTGAVLVWDGTSTAENQAIDRLSTRLVDGLLHVEFVYRVSENGSRSAFTNDLFVRLGAGGLEWAK